MLLATLFRPPLLAADDKIYDGITPEELAAFAEGDGWQADVSRFSVEVRVDGKSIRIEMFDCDEAGRCEKGFIQDMTYYFLEPSSYGFWHWNLERRGATGFGPSYVTLQRYLHFRGVTDQYLRDVIGEIWPKAAESFWTEVKKRYEAERQSDMDSSVD